MNLHEWLQLLRIAGFRTDSTEAILDEIAVPGLVGGDWNHGIWIDFPILGLSSSHLTKSIIFQRGRLKPPTSWINPGS